MSQVETQELFYKTLEEMAKKRAADQEGYFSFTYNELCRAIHIGKDKVKRNLQQLAEEKRISLRIGAGTAKTKVKIEQ